MTYCDLFKWIYSILAPEWQCCPWYSLRAAHMCHVLLWNRQNV